MNKSARLVPVPATLMALALGVLGKRDMYRQLFCDLEIDNRKARMLVGWEPCENPKLELESVGSRYQMLSARS